MKIREAVESYISLDLKVLEIDVESKRLRVERRKLGERIFKVACQLNEDAPVASSSVKFAVGSKQVEISRAGEMTVISDLPEIADSLEV